MKKIVSFIMFLFILYTNINAQINAQSFNPFGLIDALGGISGDEYINIHGREIFDGDMVFLFGGKYAIMGAESYYKKAVELKDPDKKLLGAYRLLELEKLKDNKNAKAEVYAEKIIKQCLMIKKTPDLKMEEFYAQKNILKLDKMAILVKTGVQQNPMQQPIIVDQSIPSQSIQPTPKTFVQKSDVDINIPQNIEYKGSATFVVIVANENYRREAKVPHANNDGNIFKEYCLKALGIPEENIKCIVDASLNDLKYNLNWLKQVMEVYKGEAKVVFYYAGHGIPDEANKTAYLLPIDGYASDVATGYSLSTLYAELGQIPAKSVLVLLDACFSGAKREGDMLASARGVAIKVKKSAPKGNMVVFSAAQGDETAYPYKEQRHGMFTYYLLKKLQETKGEATLGEISDYVTSEVRKQSIVINGKMQTPTLTSSSAIGDSWRNWKLK